jgi:hypothetical protein
MCVLPTAISALLPDLHLRLAGESIDMRCVRLMGGLLGSSTASGPRTRHCSFGVLIRELLGPPQAQCSKCFRQQGVGFEQSHRDCGAASEDSAGNDSRTASRHYAHITGADPHSGVAHLAARECGMSVKTGCGTGGRDRASLCHAPNTQQSFWLPEQDSNLRPFD